MENIEKNLNKPKPVREIKLTDLNQAHWDAILEIYKNVAGETPLMSRFIESVRDVEELKQTVMKHSVDYRLGSGKLGTAHSKLVARLTGWPPDNLSVEFSFFDNVDDDQEKEAVILREEFNQKVSEYLTKLE